MLAKVSSATFDVYKDRVLFNNQNISQVARASQGEINIFTETLTSSGTIYWSSITKTSNTSTKIWKGSTTIDNNYSLNNNHTGNFAVNSGDTVKITLYTSNTSDTTCNIGASLSQKYLFMSIDKPITTHKSLPREVKAIGNKATATLFGYHTNNTWYTGE